MCASCENVWALYNCGMDKGTQAFQKWKEMASSRHFIFPLCQVLSHGWLILAINHYLLCEVSCMIMVGGFTGMGSIGSHQQLPCLKISLGESTRPDPQISTAGPIIFLCITFHEKKYHVWNKQFYCLGFRAVKTDQVFPRDKHVDAQKLKKKYICFSSLLSKWGFYYLYA